ncbi:DUF262 domain-containing protein [Paenibacillus amylolyticus]|uniref:DUF262 domain-containing protein n=1 Tax=Paenibacillus amylolyticus TaxID=1451 RepID=UPI00096BD10A|nr:DUF262 domain-containing protein [Paenibacillus amylolyticus]OMF42996.1 hypothetical protein BK136_14690 [Paenibacillus amylolyticus]
MSDFKTLSMQRSSNNITISEYMEQDSLDKYHYSPDYQRHGAVWNTEQKSFLLDSIFKNYPMPPVFLRSILDKTTGKTKYDVIDGKQRLETIREFIDNKFTLPENFGDDMYGSEILNGLTFAEIRSQSGPEVDHFMNNFWNYKIPIEYITILDNNESRVVNTIFDRLNRYGEPLNGQELRNANADFYDLIKLIKKLKTPFWTERLRDAVAINRMEDDEFISELFFTLLEKQWIDSIPSKIDDLYKKWSEQLSEISFNEIEESFNEITQYLQELNIEYDRFKIKGASHLYALWGFVMYCLDNSINIDIARRALEQFYTLRNSKEIEASVIQYKQSMSSGTKSASRRKRRIEALIEFLQKYSDEQ